MLMTAVLLCRRYRISNGTNARQRSALQDSQHNICNEKDGSTISADTGSTQLRLILCAQGTQHVDAWLKAECHVQERLCVAYPLFAGTPLTVQVEGASVFHSLTSPCQYSYCSTAQNFFVWPSC